MYHCERKVESRYKKSQRKLNVYKLTQQKKKGIVLEALNNLDVPSFVSRFEMAVHFLVYPCIVLLQIHFVVIFILVVGTSILIQTSTYI